MAGYYYRMVDVTDASTGLLRYETRGCDRETSSKEIGKLVANARHGNIVINTVFLAFNFAHSLDVYPLLFETCVYTDDNSYSDVVRRYSTHLQAREGHAAIYEDIVTGRFKHRDYRRIYGFPGPGENSTHASNQTDSKRKVRL